MAESDNVTDTPAVTGRTVSGVVVSDRMDKGITVRIQRHVKHPGIRQVYSTFVQGPRARCKKRVQRRRRGNGSRVPADFENENVGVEEHRRTSGRLNRRHAYEQG